MGCGSSLARAQGMQAWDRSAFSLSAQDSYGVPAIDLLVAGGFLLSHSQAKQVVSSSQSNSAVLDSGMCGVSVELLVALDQALQATPLFSDPDGPISTAELVHTVIMPATKALNCHFLHLLHPRHVGCPTSFVSHRWGSPFQHTVGCLQAYFAQQSRAEQQDIDAHAGGGAPSLPPLQSSASAPMPRATLVAAAAAATRAISFTPLQQAHTPTPASKCFVWMDIVAVNQHTTAVKEDGGHLQPLDTVIALCQNTLLCMDTQALTLTRIWCLFEVWRTVAAKTASALKVLTLHLEVEQLRAMFSSLDVKQGRAFVEADRVSILQQMHNSVGSMQLNLQVKQALVDSVKTDGAELQAQVASIITSRHHDSAQRLLDAAEKANKLADNLFAMGAYNDAEPLYRLALGIRQQTLGMDSVLTAKSLANMSKPMVMDGARLCEAIELLRIALHIYVTKEGALSANVASSMGDLGHACFLNGQLSDAEGHLRGALHVMRVLEMDEGHDAACVHINLSMLLAKQGKWVEATEACRHAWCTMRHVVGPTHPSTLTALSNLGSCLLAQRDFTAAEEVLREVLQMTEEVLGPDHPSTSVSLIQLASAVQQCGKLDEAERLCMRARRVSLQGSAPDGKMLTNIASKLHQIDLLRQLTSMGVPMAELNNIDL